MGEGRLNNSANILMEVIRWLQVTILEMEPMKQVQIQVERRALLDELLDVSGTFGRWETRTSGNRARGVKSQWSEHVWHFKAMIMRLWRRL